MKNKTKLKKKSKILNQISSKIHKNSQILEKTKQKKNYFLFIFS